MTADVWVRMAILLVLGITALGYAGIGLAVIGAVVAAVLQWTAGVNWPTGFLIATAALYAIAVSRFLIKTPRFTSVCAVVLGVPTVLISHFLCGSTWMVAAADAVLFALLVPPAIARAVALIRALKPPAPILIAPLYISSSSPSPRVQGSRLAR